MSWDIFGNPLQRGHCEVHPHVHEEYPCSVCISEKRQHDQPSCDGRCENALYLAQADDHIKSLQARMAELEKREAAYDIILKVVSNALERAGVTECDNPGDAIEMITKERDGLLSQLPEGMKHCTIIFKECDKGHGWLTATNWVQHGCPKCEFDRIVDEKHELQRLRRQSSNMVSALHLEACQWRLKAEKAEQERDGLAAKLKLVIDCGDSCCDEYCKDEWELAVNASADKAIARIRAEAVREAKECSVFAYEAPNADYDRGYSDAIEAFDKHMDKFAAYLEANQIEREGGV